MSVSIRIAIPVSSSSRSAIGRSGSSARGSSLRDVRISVDSPQFALELTRTTVTVVGGAQAVLLPVSVAVPLVLAPVSVAVPLVFAPVSVAVPLVFVPVGSMTVPSVSPVLVPVSVSVPFPAAPVYRGWSIITPGNSESERTASVTVGMAALETTVPDGTWRSPLVFVNSKRL